MSRVGRVLAALALAGSALFLSACDDSMPPGGGDTTSANHRLSQVNYLTGEAARRAAEQRGQLWFGAAALGAVALVATRRTGDAS